MSKFIVLKRTLVEALEGIQIFYKKAPTNAAYPYAVFFIERGVNEYLCQEDFVVDFNIYHIDSDEADLYSESINERLNKQTFIKDGHSFTVFLINRTDDEDDDVEHRFYTYSVREMEA